MRRGIGGLLLVVMIGCASQRTPAPDSSSSLPEPPGLREEGLLLLMADRRHYDSFTVGSIRFENPDLAASLALSLGRIGDSRGLPALHTLLLEGKPQVRREAAFAAGLLADPLSTRQLLGAVADTDSSTGIWAVAGLADFEVPLERVVQSLGTTTSTDR